MQIPKIIHFIWAGGTQLMPDEGIKSILQWLEQNPDFRVWLWVDHKTWPIDASEDIESSYDRKFKESVSPNSATYFDRIEFKDIETDLFEIIKGENAVLSVATHEHIRYEIDKLRPNYGASSDLLRYLILYQYGGAYFDSDVVPDEVTLSDSGIFDQNFAEEKHRLFIDINSQDTGSIGNDSLICSATSHNPHIRLILEIALDNYRATTAVAKTCPLTGLEFFSTCYVYNEPVKQAYLGDNLDFIVSVTPLKTGPACVQAVAKPLLDAGSEYIQSLEKIVKPVAGGNQRKWAVLKLNKFSAEQAMAAIIYTIRFEMQHLGIIRLEDHASNLALILKQPTEVATQRLMDKLETSVLEFSTVEACQLTFRYPAITEFILNRPELCDVTYLFPDLNHFDKVSANSWHHFAIRQIINAELLPSLIDSIDLDNQESAQPQQTLYKGLNFINIAFDRLQTLLSHLDGIHSETDDNYVYLTNYLSELRKPIEVVHQLVQKYGLNETPLPIDFIKGLRQQGEVLGVQLAAKVTVVLPHLLPTANEQAPLIGHHESDDDQPTGGCRPC